ncbi:MAG: LysM peptidoglycan-binding domain-containing protein [Planctomycetota bacterium]|nr:LysM peptidoglycan-binding domain-containing protein [Planctomycetota bacterium]
MNALKSLVLLTVLVSVGAMVYQSLYKGGPVTPDGTDPAAVSPISVEIGGTDETAGDFKPQVLSPSGGSAPAFGAAPSRDFAGSTSTASSMPPPVTSLSASQPSGSRDFPSAFAPPAASSPPADSSSVEAANSSVPPAGGNTAALPIAAFSGSPAGASSDNVADPLAAAGKTPTDPAKDAELLPFMNDGRGPTNAAATNPNEPSAYQIARQNIEPLLQAGRLEEALKELSVWNRSPELKPTEVAELHDLLSKLAGTVVYSREHHLAPAYQVQEGEKLTDIAQKHGLPWELLAKINGIQDPNQLYTGESLKVMRGPFSASVHLQDKHIDVMINGAYAGRFELIGAGPDVATLKGEHTVTKKTVKPVYNGPEGEIPAGDPRNPLGSLLIVAGKGLAIHDASAEHATAEDPRTTLRLKSRDMEDLFDILSLGSRITVNVSEPSETTIGGSPTGMQR